MKYLVSFLISALFLVSCEQEVNINDDWQEKAIIYALLDHKDSTQYIRVQKAYLGEGDVIQMGQETDSIYYSDNINVTLQAYDGNTAVGDAIQLVDTFVTKAEGQFASEGHLVYKTPFKTGVLNNQYDYEVLVENPSSGYQAKARTSLIGDFNFTGPNTTVLNLAAKSPLTVEWKKADNALIYQLVMRFHYKEDEVSKFIDLAFTQRDITNNNSQGVREVFDMSRIYGYLADNLEPTNTKVRIAEGIEFIVYAGGEEYSLYADLNTSSGTLVEERPEYTNVENGFGLVSSRTSITSIDYFSGNDLIEMYDITDASLDTLVCGHLTQDLNFAKIEVLPNNTIDTLFCN